MRFFMMVLLAAVVGCEAEALHYAAREGDLETVKELVARGANLEVRNSDGATALHEAVREGHLEIVKVLVGGGADVHATNRRGRTPLHYAAWFGQLAEVEFLVGSGADVNATDDDGETPRDDAASCITSISSFATAAVRADCADVVEYFDSL